MFLNVFKLFLLCVLCAATPAWPQEKESRVIISQPLENFDCHGSSLIELSQGVVYVVWKGGHGSGKSSVDIPNRVGIWGSKYIDGSWTPAQLVSFSKDNVYWAPVLTKLPSSELLLFYRIGKDPRHAIGVMRRSLDEGESWSEEEILPAGILGPTRSRPTVLQDGTLICGSSTEAGAPTDSLKATACWIEIGREGGRVWERHGPLEIPGRKFGAIEPVLFFDTKGNLKLLCRDRAHKVGETGYIWSSSSSDGGVTWSSLTNTSLPNPDSGIEIVDCGSGNIVLFYNPSHTERSPLSFALSKDGGITWSKPTIIDAGVAEFPSALLTSNGQLHVTYAWTPPGKEQRCIKHVILK